MGLDGTLSFVDGSTSLAPPLYHDRYVNGAPVISTPIADVLPVVEAADNITGAPQGQWTYHIYAAIQPARARRTVLRVA
jgi:hypothetical protein